jgi:hypothetical protein
MLCCVPYSTVRRAGNFLLSGPPYINEQENYFVAECPSFKDLRQVSIGRTVLKWIFKNWDG